MCVEQTEMWLFNLFNKEDYYYHFCWSAAVFWSHLKNCPAALGPRLLQHWSLTGFDPPPVPAGDGNQYISRCVGHGDCPAGGVPASSVSHPSLMSEEVHLIRMFSPAGPTSFKVRKNQWLFSTIAGSGVAWFGFILLQLSHSSNGWGHRWLKVGRHKQNDGGRGSHDDPSARSDSEAIVVFYRY